MNKRLLYMIFLLICRSEYSTVQGPEGQEMKTSAKYTLDGKECENSGIMNMKTKSTVIWSADKKSVTITSLTIFNMNGDNMKMKSSEILKLDGDKTLKIDATNDTPDGEMKTSLVYDKKYGSSISIFKISLEVIL